MSAVDAVAIQWQELPVVDQVEVTSGLPTVKMSYAVHQQILAHVEADLTCECGGLLFGHRIAFDEHRPVESFGTLIIASHPATTAASSLTHFVMHPETWLPVWREVALQPETISLAGWYHSHPGHGAFLSSTDRATQAVWFRQTWQVAYVIDPVWREEAVFCGPQGVKASLIL